MRVAPATDMEKPESLRKLLLETVPGLKQNPERLALFIDKGGIHGGHGRSLSFEYRFTLNLVIESYAGDMAALVVPVLAWIAENQPELIGGPDAQPFRYEAEILDDESRDVSIFIDLREAVIVVPREGGGYGVKPAPIISPASRDRFDAVPNCTKLWQLFLNDCLIAQTGDPAFGP